MSTFLIGLLSGILTTLIAGNPHVRFRIEKGIRTIVKKPLVSVSLSTFVNYCEDGMLMLHCLELKSNMLFTNTIPKVYFISYGPWAGDSRAYKPFIYFREHGMKEARTEVPPSQVLHEYSDSVIPYAPDKPGASLDISKRVPKRVVAICESIGDLRKQSQDNPLNTIRIVGKLHAAVANPMPKVSPGASWGITIISEEFGFVDHIAVGIPANLKRQDPLGDSWYVLRMKERPMCLIDISNCGLTWPLRLEIQDNRFKSRRKLVQRRGGISVMRRRRIQFVEFWARCTLWICGIVFAFATIQGMISSMPELRWWLIFLLFLLLISAFVTGYADLKARFPGKSE